jgi:hypothetical protein
MQLEHEEALPFMQRALGSNIILPAKCSGLARVAKHGSISSSLMLRMRLPAIDK